MIKFRNENLPKNTKYRYLGRKHVNFAFREGKCIGRSCFNPGRVYPPKPDRPIILTRYLYVTRKRSKFSCCETWILDGCPTPLPEWNEELQKERFKAGWQSFVL